MKLYLTLLLCLALQTAISQTPKVATSKSAQPTQLQLVKNLVVLKSKNNLELPKYFKLEKITAEISKKGGGYESVSIGVNPIDPMDTFYKKKVLIIEIEDEYSLGTYKSYSIDSVNKVHDTYFFYLKGELEAYTFPSNSVNFGVYEKAIQEKIYNNRIYTTKIIYWAMSKGGQLRLYTDYGLVSINEKGKMTYVVSELE